MRWAILVVMLFIVAAVGCSGGVSQSYAEAESVRFLEERAKFFTKDNVSNISVVSEYKIGDVSSFSEGELWISIIRIESRVGNSTKSTSVRVEIDKGSGKVVKFNGLTVK
ncbi:hypothetical protein HYU11_04615 [Candidatus Woesearchaeota archaeon]|nr:hypothetical protein [Candidatus Woesearchaeota archaeon]